jgi:hypothetical protein
MRISPCASFHHSARSPVQGRDSHSTGHSRSLIAGLQQSLATRCLQKSGLQGRWKSSSECDERAQLPLLRVASSWSDRIAVARLAGTVESRAFALGWRVAPRDAWGETQWSKCCAVCGGLLRCSVSATFFFISLRLPQANGAQGSLCFLAGTVESRAFAHRAPDVGGAGEFEALHCRRRGVRLPWRGAPMKPHSAQRGRLTRRRLRQRDRQAQERAEVAASEVAAAHAPG